LPSGGRADQCGPAGAEHCKPYIVLNQMTWSIQTR
jgi:hypothetical protein